MIGFIAYIVVGLVLFFAASFLVARYSRSSNPTDPNILWGLVGLTLMWPLTVPLFAVIILLFGIAKLTEKLAGYEK